MKFGFDAKRAVSNRTGLGNYSRSLLRELATRFPEHSYHLFSASPEAGLIAADLPQYPNWHLHSSNMRMKAYWRSFSMTKDLLRTNIELYHGLSNELPFGIEKTGIKSVVTIHDLIFKAYPETYSLSERLIYDRKFRHACQVADRIIAVSEHTKQDICRLYGTEPRKVHVIYQSCRDHFYVSQSTEELERVRRAQQLPETYLLYVGTVEARKNLLSIIRAYAGGLRHEGVPLVIVGRGGAYAQKCRREITAAGMDSLFLWKEDIRDSRELQSIMQGAAALIYPSSYEGFGLPVAEASLCGTPVITADNSSLPEAGGPHVWYIQPEKPESIAVAARYILTHPAEATERAKAARDYIRQLLDPGKLSQQLMDCYLSLCSRP